MYNFVNIYYEIKVNYLYLNYYLPKIKNNIFIINFNTKFGEHTNNIMKIAINNDFEFLNLNLLNFLKYLNNFLTTNIL
jgi:hypothetical protein